MDTIRREFLGWDRSALDTAVDYLADRYTEDGRLDMSRVVIAMPGGRAGRRLEELLIERAESIDPAWLPPRIMTIGRLPEHLYEPQKPFADELVLQLAWLQAIRAVDRQVLQQVLPMMPEEENLEARLALARMLSQLHRELAADGMTFLDVARKLETLDAADELPRWHALARIQDHYLHMVLDPLDLWDLQTARLVAVEKNECQTDHDIILVGTVDMNRSQRRMLDQVADQVTALVFAPPELADHFDGHGCLEPRRWRDRLIPIEERQIDVSGNPADQADSVVRWLATLDARYAADQITVGVASEELVPYVKQRLDECGVRARYGVGEPIGRSVVVRTLRAIAEFIESRRYTAFAALVRTPGVVQTLATTIHSGLSDQTHDDPSTLKPASQYDWLSVLDRYHTEHLPSLVDGRWRGAGDADRVQLDAVYQAVMHMLEPLMSSPSSDTKEESSVESKGLKSRSLGDWTGPMVELLVRLFGSSPLDRNDPSDRRTLLVCEKLHDALETFRDMPESLMPKADAALAIRLLLRELEGEMIPADADPDAVELLGWLELALDDAPALCVMQVNEGTIPSSLNADQFLPNTLRNLLGIEDNDRRYARDAYAMSLIIASRPEVRLIVGRRTAQGDPLPPSRLLFACDDETMAERARRFFDETVDAPRVLLSGSIRPGSDSSQFAVPRPMHLDEPVTSMRVTEFRDYLACPYRYYLRHRLKLEPLDDRRMELDGAAFGSLAHDVLKRFGESDVRHSTSPDTIRECFDTELSALVKQRYGKSAMPAVAVQIEQLRVRLGALAQWQADWAAQGWLIEHVEIQPNENSAFLEVDGRKMGLRGRIDRIDVHQETGSRIVFDYKTSDSAKTPMQTHQRAGQWIDLQLPLYRHLLDAIGIDSYDARLAYILMPKDANRIGESIANWSEDDLQQADAAARQVALQVWEQRFWPPADPAPAFSEPYAAICLDYRFDLPPDLDES